MIKKTLLPLFLVFFVTPSLWALPLGGDFKVKTGFMLTDFQSSLQYDKNNIQGTKLNLGSDLNLENNTVVPFFEVWLGGRFVLNLAYMDSKYEGDVRTASQITHNGVQLTDGLGTKQLDLSIEFRTFDIAVQFNILNNKKIRAGAIAGLKYFYYKNRIVNSTDSIVSNNDEETMLPYIGGEVEVTPIKYISFNLRLRGGNYRWTEFNIKRGEYLDFELGASFNFTPFISLMIEYRFFQVSITRNHSVGNAARFSNAIDSVVFSVIARI